MEHLSKRSQVQRIELGKTQVLLERLNLEAMLKDWYNLQGATLAILIADLYCRASV